MTPRERVLRAINHEWPDKAPKEADFTPTIHALFREKTGRDDHRDYFGIEMRGVGFRRSREMKDFSAYLRHLPAGARITSEYGTADVPGDFYHFTHRVFTLGEANAVEEVEAYPWPDVTPSYRHDHLEGEVARLHDQDYFVDAFAGHIFEVAWQIIGFEQMFEKMITNPPFVEAVLDRITADNCFRARRFSESGVDMLRTGDDVGMQDRLMMPVEMWRYYLKPRLRRVIAAARAVRPGIPVWYHSDGDISPIIDDLIDVGVTVLNPVQPECMDVGELKHRYSDHLAFWGTVGTQTVMPFGTPDDVRLAIKRMIDLFAPAIVVAPTHVLEPEVPWENVCAFFEAVEEYGS